MQKYKKYIPNVLTSLRIIMIPVIIILGLFELYPWLILVSALTIFTDALDGFLARRWHVESKLGAILDALADKLLSATLLVLLIIKDFRFIYVFGLEFAIGMFNAFFYLRSKESMTLYIGKIKTWVISIAILLGFLNLISSTFGKICQFFYVLTLILQVITFISYAVYWIKIYQFMKNKEEHRKEFYEIIDPFVTHEEFLKRKEFPHHINESVYDHVLKVAYDCYELGKLFHLDYTSLAIAGLLHDFYEKPWQYTKEKKPLLQRHGFTHAKNAVENAKRVFGEEAITPKIESIMITHMFPLNKRIPRNLEAWLITIVDKADSIDFIMHPIILYKIMTKKEYDQEKKFTLSKLKSKLTRQFKKQKRIVK